MRIISFTPLHEQCLPLMELDPHQRRIFYVERLIELLDHPAELRIEQTELAVARTLAEEAMSLAIEWKRAVQIGYAHRVLASLDRLEGQFSDAEDQLQKSLEKEDSTRYIDFWQAAWDMFGSLGVRSDSERIHRLIQKMRG